MSPSTVVVGRTGTGTAADIVKAHQEKDALISSLTRERDLARKELNAKSNQERDVRIVSKNVLILANGHSFVSRLRTLKMYSAPKYSRSAIL